MANGLKMAVKHAITELLERVGLVPSADCPGAWCSSGNGSAIRRAA